MADYDTIFAFEDAFETAIASVIGTATTPCLTSRSAVKLTTPRAVVFFASKGATGHRTICPRDGLILHDVYNAEVTIQIVTKRGEDDAAIHSTTKGRAREIMARAGFYFTPAILPNHAFVTGSVAESGSTETDQDDHNQDVSDISFNCTITIRPEALN